MQLEAIAEQAYRHCSVSDTSNAEAVKQAVGNQPAKPVKTAAAEKKGDGFIGDCPACQCEKCRKRRYQDGSNDSRVSFQMPTVMDPVKAKTKECGTSYVKGGFTKTVTRPSLVEFRKVISGTLDNKKGKKLIGIA